MSCEDCKNDSVTVCKDCNLYLASEDKKLKKVGILTYHYVINEGAILQAHSLSVALRKYFDNVEIIDYRPRRTEIMYLLKYIVSKNPIVSFQRYFRSKIFIRDELPLSKRKLTTDNYDKALGFLKGRYDLIVVGSDEVWKISCLRPFPNIYWLSPKLDCKKIAFAVSANTLNYHKLTTKEKNWIKDSLESFHFIGVRDRHTFDFVKSLGIKNVDKLIEVPDPTFVYQIKNTHVKEYLIKSGIDLEKPVLGILLSDEKLGTEFIRHYRIKGYQVIALSSFNRHADVNLIGKLDPFEWAEVFKYFTFCVTDRFHGTIFCLKNKRPFISIDHSKRYLTLESKIYSLLRDFSLLDNYINTNHDSGGFLDKAEQSQKNWNVNKVTQKLDQMEKKCHASIKRIVEVLDNK